MLIIVRIKDAINVGIVLRHKKSLCRASDAV